MIVGTAVRITVTTNIQGDEGRITIYNPDNTEKIAETAMTDIENLTYEYIFQSEDTDQTGIYTAIIEVDNGDYTSKTNIKFNLKSQLED